MASVAWWAISASDSVIAHEATSAITGSFTVINAARPVTAELRHNSANDAIVSTITIPIAPANVSTPVTFEFDNVYPGTYSLIFGQPGHTSFTLNNIVVAGGVNVDITRDPNFPLQLPLRPGNITGSGQVNVTDLTMLLQHWLTSDISANFTGSGQVNVADLSLLLQNWMAESVVVQAIYVQQPTPTPPPAGDPPYRLIFGHPHIAGRIGQEFYRSVRAFGTEPITWTIESGGLPSGLSLDANTGAVTGTPTTAGVFDFVVRADNAFGSSTLAHSITVERGLSSILLPNRRLTWEERDAWMDDYIALGGPTAVELEIARLVNIERANYGLAPVQIDERLMMAARFYAQQFNDLRNYHPARISHNFGPYATNPEATHGASANVSRAFGGNLRWNGGNGHSGGSSSAQAVVSAWMNSSGHRRYILSPEHRFVGAGQFPGGISYLFLSEYPSSTQRFIMTFNANGGTGTMPEQVIYMDHAQWLSQNTFTKEGYTFVGWRLTPADIGIVQYVDGVGITITDDRTMYAVWVNNQPDRPRQFALAFDANGGRGTMQPQTFQCGEWQAVRWNIFTKPGYTFAGWGLSPTSDVVLPNRWLTVVQFDLTLYAVWE